MAVLVPALSAAQWKATWTVSKHGWGKQPVYVNNAWTEGEFDWNPAPDSNPGGDAEAYTQWWPVRQGGFYHEAFVTVSASVKVEWIGNPADKPTATVRLICNTNAHYDGGRPGTGSLGSFNIGNPFATPPPSGPTIMTDAEGAESGAYGVTGYKDFGPADQTAGGYWQLGGTANVTCHVQLRPGDPVSSGSIVQANVSFGIQIIPA